MNADELSIFLLREIVHSWTEHETEIEIGSDPHKIEVLKIASDVLKGGGHPIPLEVVDLYQRVFLRDVWT